MSVLALDLGTQTGWAFRDSGVTLTGSINLKGGRFEGGGMRFLRFRAFLKEMHEKNPIKLCYYEEVRAHKGTDAAHIYGGLQATLTSFCEENKIPYEGVPVQEIKKFVTGKGNAGKPQVIAAVRARGFDPTDDNEADAIALLLLKTESAEAQFLT